jgi:hypothetical protein
MSTPERKQAELEPIYLLDQTALDKLDAMQQRLHGGTDRERDEGHRLWLIVCEIKEAGPMTGGA